MAYDETLAQRIRESLADEPELVQKKMFGGIAFMLRGHLCCGVISDEVMIRTGPAAYEKALERPHAREMDFTGGPMRGLVVVGSERIATAESLDEWVQIGVDFVSALPPK